MVEFNQIPADTRVPFVYVEFDASNAQQGPQLQPYKVLVIGQRVTGSGNVVELTPTKFTTADQVAEAFGFGSMLHNQAQALFRNNKVTEATFVGIDDAGGAVKSTGSIDFTGSVPTENGTVAVYIAGRRIALTVTTASTATTIAAALVTAVTALTELPVTASNTAGDVTLTAKNGGEEGDSVDLRHSYASGESLPAGVAVAVTAMSGGTTNPDVTEVWPVLGDTHYNVLAVGFNDQTTLTALDAELADRWGPTRQIEGHAFAGVAATHGALITLGNANNSKHVTLVGADGSPSPPWEWAAALAGNVARYGQADPARPFQTLEMVGVVAPLEVDRFTLAERDLLLRDGIATFTVTATGKVLIERTVTTYQTNDAGAPDTTFLDVNTLLTLAFLRYDFRTSFQAKYPRHKLADDGTRFGPGQAIITPAIGRAEAIAKFREWEDAALVEGGDQFKRDLVVERSATDPNRLEFLLPPDLVNQLRVTGVQIGFLI